MNSYELTVMVENPAEAENLKKSVTSLKGKITDEKHWGKLALTYPIDKLTSADYFTFQIKMDKKDISQLKQKLNFDDKIVRFLLLNGE